MTSGHIDKQGPLYAKIARSLLADIAKGRLRSGDRVPTEDELMKTFVVSRITVRQALELLRQRGLVERIAGRGSFVTTPPGSYVMTVNSVDDVVQAGAETDVTILEWKAVRAAPFVERRLQLSAPEAWVLRSLRSRNGTPLCYSETYTRPDIGPRLDPDDFRRRTVIETIETKLGFQVGMAVEDISAGVAERGLAAHLNIPRGSPLVILEVTFVDLEGRPIEYVKTCYRADRFKRRSELERVRHGTGTSTL